MDTKRLSCLLAAGALVIAIAAVVALVARLDRQMINAVVLILVISIAIALIIAATALPLHARKPERPHERERIIKEIHTIDGRVAEAPKIHVMQPGGYPMYPDMLRAAYLAGGHQFEAQAPQLIEGETKTIDEWVGPIHVDDAGGANG